MVLSNKVIQEGYKMSEFGKIPIEWKVNKISDLAIVKTGGTPSKTKREYWTNGTIPWMTSGEVNLKRVYDVHERITDLGYQSSNTSILPVKTIMMALNGQGKTRGMVALLEVETTCNQSLAGILPSEKFNSDYLYYFLESSYERLRGLTGEGRSGLNLSLIRDFTVISPTIHEQQKIAEIFSTVDEQIENTEQLIEKTKELKKGLMQQLLTKGIGHTEFKQTELGEIPVEWEVRELNQVTDYVDYRGKTPSKQESGVTLITAKNIKSGYINYEVSREYIAETDYENVMRRGKPKKGEVLFTTEAPLGNVAQVDNEKIALAQRVIKFNGNELLKNTFLKYFMLSDSFQTRLFKKATGSTVKGIQGKQLHKLQIILPPLLEQQKIASILSSVDEQIESYKQEKEKYLELKKGLMQQLLTGKIRVTV